MLLRLLLILALMTAISGRLNAQVTDVTIGITPTCPYGCWPGAISALRTFENVASIDRTPDAVGLTIRVTLVDPSLIPSPGTWRKRFEAIVGRAYVFRGVEITASGVLRRRDGRPALELPGGRFLQLIAPGTLRYNGASRATTDPSANTVLDSANAFENYSEADRLYVTGVLQESDDRYCVEVRTCRRAAR